MDNIPIPHQYPDQSPLRVNNVLNRESTHDEEDEVNRGSHARYTASRSASLRAEDGISHEIWTKTTRPRGRKARDAQAQYVRFHCKDIDDLETNLREYLAAPTAPAEHATIKFHFPSTSAFLVYTRDFKRDSSTNWTSADVTDLVKRTAVSVVEVLQPTQNPKDQIIRQKAVARTIIEAIQKVDRFRYSFNNNWLSKEDQAHRFSFFCNDSTLNKGRAANGGAGTEGREHRKPAYECKGFISVKFSVTKNNLEVHYTHIPLHKTYDERAPVPRRESKRRRMMEVLDPEGLEALRDAKKQRLREERLAAGWIPTKTGRLARPGTEINDKETPTLNWRQASGSPSTNNIQRDSAADEALQPLLDFLGSAERVTPDGDQNEQGRDHDNGEDNVTSVSASFEPTPKVKRPRGRPRTRPESARRKPARTSTDGPRVPDGRSKFSGVRAKMSGPLLPGMMEGSIQSGNMDWKVTTPTTPDQRQASQQAGSNTGGEQTRAKQNTAPLNSDEQEETEIQLLKRRLYETEQRLLRIEAEKGVPSSSTMPPQPYPPPFYPQYPYYPYPLPTPHYPPATFKHPHAAALQPGTHPHQPQPTVAQANVSITPAPSNTAQVLAATVSTPPAEAQSNGTVTTSAATSQPVNPTTSQAPTQIPAPDNHAAHTSPVQMRPPWPAGLPMPEPPPPLRQPPTPLQQQQPVAGVLKYAKECGQLDLTADSEAVADANLKGLFDSAMAAITRLAPAASSGRHALDVRTSNDKDKASEGHSIADFGKSTKSSGNDFRPPRGAAAFQISGYQTPNSAKKAKKSKRGTDDATLARADSSNSAPSTGVPSRSIYTQPPYPYPYPYPYPPYQYPYPPPPAGSHPPPPPPGHPPYPPPGYPPYPLPPAGYGYPPYPPYPYPPAVQPAPAETEVQKKAREQKEKDTAENAPSWATQLREAMTGYASSNPAPVSLSASGTAPASAMTVKEGEKGKDMESTQVASTASESNNNEGAGIQNEDGVQEIAEVQHNGSQG